MPNSSGTSPAGKWTAHVQVNGANQEGNILHITATKGDVFRFEDIFTIDGVHDIEPDGTPTGQRKRFMVLEHMVAKGNSSDILKIMPPIVGPGRYCANVDTLPASGAILEWIA